jgi:hypothetical protein
MIELTVIDAGQCLGVRYRTEHDVVINYSSNTIFTILSIIDLKYLLIDGIVFWAKIVEILIN